MQASPVTYVRSSHRSQITGTLVTIYDTAAPENEFDPDGGRWVTFCEDHGTICNHITLALARHHAPTVDWCEECSANPRTVISKSKPQIKRWRDLRQNDWIICPASGLREQVIRSHKHVGDRWSVRTSRHDHLRPSNETVMMA